jgi:hypothetical protein
MGRGNSYSRLAQRLVCGVLLLALRSSGLGIGQSPLEVDSASNQAQLSGAAATETAQAEVADSKRLIEAERKTLAAHLNKKAESFLPKSLSQDDGQTNYLISSFPEFRCINYVRLPDLVWRPLVVSGLGSPHSVVVDEDRLRLYVVDNAVVKIFWYQLIALPDGTLISDGRQHIAVQNMAVRNLALDLEGNLWFSGTSTPVPPIPPIDAIWKQPLMIIDQSLLSGVPIDPLPQWTSGHTKSSPSPLVLDAFSIYYGNGMQGKEKGSVIKAGQAVPAGGGGLVGMADNTDTVYSIAVTPTVLFYGADNAIYGVAKTKVGASCGATGDQCKVITDLVKKPTSMLWDGDGTIYVADNGAGAIYSFASGSASPHALDKIIDAGEVYGLDVLTVVKGAAARGAPSLVLALLFLFAACS